MQPFSVAPSMDTKCNIIFFQHTVDLLFISILITLFFCSKEIAKQHAHLGGWEHICRYIPLCHVGNHPQGDLILVFPGALAPQPLNLHHCHLKNIVVSHLRDSNLSFKSAYLRSCHHTVATWKDIVLEDIFSSVTNESFLSLKKAQLGACTWVLFWTAWGLFSPRGFMPESSGLFLPPVQTLFKVYLALALHSHWG